MSDMSAYFIRRLLLVPLTFVVVTFLVYAILRLAPGGPIEQAEAAMRLSAMQGEAGGGGGRAMGSEGDLMLPEDALEDLERYYALDQPIPVAYLQWLGAAPRTFRQRVPPTTLDKNDELFAPLRKLHERKTALQAELDETLAPAEAVAYDGAVYRPVADGERKDLPEELKSRADSLAAAGFGKRDQLLAFLAPYEMTFANGRLYRKMEDKPENAELLKGARERLAALQLAGDLQRDLEEKHGYEISRDGSLYRLEKRFSGILQGDFGQSYTHNEPVLPVITSRFEVSIVFGLTGYVLTWLICVPLGVMKAVRHRSTFDSVTSFLVLLAYSIPGYILAMLLLATLGKAGYLPLGGFKPPTVEGLNGLEVALERLRYLVIPVTAYVVGMFATMTMLMKNSVMENLTADYVRTAFAKGLRERRVLFVHVLRNSLIPITAGIGHAIGLLFAGSFLIEKTCNIPGMGLLGYQALVQRDYPIVMGILVFGVLVTLLGNILSDLIWAAIDPRIRFGGRRA